MRKNMDQTEIKNEKDKKINKEYRRIKGLFKDLPEHRRSLADGQMRRAAFMRIALEELEETIKTEGTLDVFEQGAYAYNREHPALKSYNATIKNYTAIIKQLNDMLPQDAARVENDGFDSFIARSRD